jgi:uracil-DNA glycosylase
MSVKNSSRWHSAIELYRRLGIRYVSNDTRENPPISAALPETESTAFVEHPVIEKESVESSVPHSHEKSSWITAATDTIQAMELTAFDQDICECQKCPLGATRKHFVFGSGNPQAKVLFIGEAPGADEDEKGLPFVGRAGQLLTKIIESTQTWKRSDVFICNVLKCRPPGNRTPLPEEVEQCRPYLEEQIQIIKPRVIMALGAVAAQALLRSKDSVGKMRNRWHDHHGIPLRVTYHPAALLRFDGYKKDVWQDMKELTAKYQELEGLA